MEQKAKPSPCYCVTCLDLISDCTVFLDAKCASGLLGFILSFFPLFLSKFYFCSFLSFFSIKKPYCTEVWLTYRKLHIFNVYISMSLQISIHPWNHHHHHNELMDKHNYHLQKYFSNLKTQYPRLVKKKLSSAQALRSHPPEEAPCMLTVASFVNYLHIAK